MAEHRQRLRRRARLALEVVRSYVRVRLLLRRADLPTVLQTLRKRRAAGAPPRDPVDVGRHLGRAVVHTLRHLPGDSRCLVRSLVLVDLLAARAIEADLVIGVAPPGGSSELAAHAWVERSGVALLRDDEHDFPRLAAL
jgi:hypothetical protein